MRRGVFGFVVLSLFGVVVLFLIVGGVGCSNSADATKAAAAKTKVAIERVWSADQKLAKVRDNLPPKATPSQISWAIGVYCDDLEKIDMSDCPADFRVAYTQHIRAWRESQEAVKQLPDSFFKGLAMGFFNGVFRGERDGGTSRLEGDLKRAAERTRSTWEEVEKIGAKYGAAL